MNTMGSGDFRRTMRRVFYVAGVVAVLVAAALGLWLLLSGTEKRQPEEFREEVREQIRRRTRETPNRGL